MAGEDIKGPETVSVETISTLPPVAVPDADDQALARKEAEALAHEQEYFRKELGWLGKPFGGRAEKPGNISALVIVLCFVAMFIIYVWPPSATLGPVMTVERIYSSLISVVTLILGYLFGSNERSSK